MQGHEKAQKALFGTMPLEDLLASDHPLRKTRSDFDLAYARLASAFETSYGSTGSVSSGAAEALLGEVVRIAESRRLLSSDRLVVDGTQIRAWAGMKNFKGTQRSNKTHESTTDPDAKLLRKGKGQELMLCHLGHILVDSVSGLVRSCKLTKACGLGGNAEVIAALEMALGPMKRGQTLDADRGYDNHEFVSELRCQGIKAHPRTKKKKSALLGRRCGTTTIQPNVTVSNPRKSKV